MTDGDDDRLGALFRAAASDSGAPPPGFDHSAVVDASRRVTARRRAALTGAGLALLVVAGVGTAVTLPTGDGGGAGDASTVAAPMLAPASPPGGNSRARDEGAPEAAAAPAPDAAAATGPPLGPGTGECADRQDPALRSLVEQVLPEVVGAPEAATTEECRPGGERGVNVEVSDGAATGLLSVQYLPPGVTVSLVEGALSAPTASGGTVVVSSRADRPGEPAPLADRIAEAVAYLAPRL